MSRHIDADALKIPSEEMIAKMIIDSAPSIDIVRCKERKYFIDNLTENDTDETYDACRWDWKKCIPKADDFCSRGERKESE